jgi:Domain of unknown function (DUF4062)
MENMGSTEERPKDECERLIREESAAFVGIYARRWGYTPPGDTQSITAYEYEAAGKLGLHRFIYLLDIKAKWPDADCEQGEPQIRLERFKMQLKECHCVSFFSGSDQLAAMVAADLGNYFARQHTRDDGLQALSQMSLDREHRLLKEIGTSPGINAERAIAALARDNSTLVVDTLHRIVLGDDVELSKRALDALGKMRGEQAGRALAAGLASTHADVRFWAAFCIGEGALQNHYWGLTFVPDLISAASLTGDQLDTICQIAHSLGKIGGEKARDAMVALLRRPGSPPKLAATILDAIRFWSDGMFASSASYGLVDDFIQVAQLEIKGWDHDFCRAIKEDLLYRYIPAPLQDASDGRAQSSD